MCELTEVTYMPGDVVWVKLGNCWWPGEVKDNDSLPEEIMANLRKKPIAVVKFFGEDSYEYVKNLDHIYHYNNRRKMEFIKKGMDITRAKSKQGSNVMDKFPTDVVTAESLTGGDVDILSTDAFMPKERPQYKDLFGSPSKKKSPKKNGMGRPSTEPKFSSERKPSQSILGKVNSLIQIKQRITHPRFIKESDHEVRIRQQPVSPAKETETVTHAYQCKECSFGTSRQNVFILHTKAHLNNVIKPETPSSSSKSSASKTKRGTKSAVRPSTVKSATKTTATKTEVEKKTTPKTPKESLARRKIFQSAKKGKKSVTPVSTPPAVVVKSAEMKERDLEKRNRILADWDDEDMEEEEKEVKKIKLEIDKKEMEIEKPKVEKPRGKIINKNPSPVEKVVSKTESSVYDLIDDAEEIVPPPRISESKRLLAEAPPPPPPPAPVETADSGELDKEVAELLQETALPELPQVPTFNLKQSTKQHHDIPSKLEEVEEPQDDEHNENEQHLDEVNGILKDNSLPVAESVPSEVFTVPASTLSTVTSPSASKTNGTTTTESTLMQSNEVVVDPNSETATYVLVTIDDSGGFQQFQTIEGMGNTLLAYDSSQGEEGGTRTLYIDPSQLGGSAAGLENLFLAIDASDGSGTSMVQIQPQQVTLQVDGTEQSTITSEELSKSKQDILAVALANTQVLQSTPLEMHGQEAVVKVTNAAQSPVMTARVTETKLVPQPQNIETSSSSVIDNITGGIR